MKCTLCDRPIDRYDPAFHHLRIDERRAADICQECIDKLVKWQSGKYAALFPTKALKKMYGKKIGISGPSLPRRTPEEKTQ